MSSLIEIVLISCVLVGGSFENSDFSLINAKSDPIDVTCSKKANKEAAYSCIFKNKSDSSKFSATGGSSLAEDFAGISNGDFGFMLGNESMNQVMQIKNGRAVYQSRSLLKEFSTSKVCTGTAKFKK